MAVVMVAAPIYVQLLDDTALTLGVTLTLVSQALVRDSLREGDPAPLRWLAWSKVQR